ncbi:cytochrome c554/c'-like protein [Alteromonadaceae bacterium 2753L.S.0a.02]|nr:cytochrome c554/c'-like protein [Alteromonadaceae bacterium 2753L.S.0a.02]
MKTLTHPIIYLFLIITSPILTAATAIENRTANVPQSHPFAPHNATTTTGRSVDHNQFQNAEVCGSCHTEIYKEWRQSIMSRSWDDPIYRALLRKASIATEGAVDNFCTGCHSPLGLLAGRIDSSVNRALPGSEQDRHLPGIDCEACHNMQDIQGLENGAYVLNGQIADTPVKFGPRHDAVSPFHNTEFSELHTESEFCGSCHNVTHPFNEVPIERTYDEWYESSYRTAGVQCQNCHMKGVEGKAAVMGPDRQDRASHHFASANTTVMSHFGDTDNVERARRLLASAAQISLITKPESVMPGELATIAFKVQNTGAGHKLPTGFPEGREVWLDVTVSDANGKRVFSSGKIKNGKTEPGTHNFKVHLGDENGNEVDVEVWNVTRILSDNRLLPNGSADVSYDFVVPDWASAPLQVNAKLQYWPFSQAVVDYLLGENRLQVQIETLATTLASIDIAGEPLPQPVALLSK